MPRAAGGEVAHAEAMGWGMDGLDGTRTDRSLLKTTVLLILETIEETTSGRVFRVTNNRIAMLTGAGKSPRLTSGLSAKRRLLSVSGC